MKTRIVGGFCALLTTACAGGPATRIGMNMPNPNGCYVKVFDREQFEGTADFINGPHRYATLSELPNRAQWSKRIRSVQVGPGAVVTVWTDEDFKGASIQMKADAKYGALIDTLAGKIQSMHVSCTPAPPTKAAT